MPDWYDPQSLNRYSYCRNNPLIYVDPSGHEGIDADNDGGIDHDSFDKNDNYLYGEFETPDGRKGLRARGTLSKSSWSAGERYGTYDDYEGNEMFFDGVLVDASDIAFEYERPLDFEYEFISLRLTTFGPLYHSGFYPLNPKRKDFGYYHSSKVTPDTMASEIVRAQYELNGQPLYSHMLYKAKTNLENSWDVEAYPYATKYDWLLHNCHHYNRAVVMEYNRLMGFTWDGEKR